MSEKKYCELKIPQPPIDHLRFMHVSRKKENNEMIMFTRLQCCLVFSFNYLQFMFAVYIAGFHCHATEKKLNYGVKPVENLA